MLFFMIFFHRVKSIIDLLLIDGIGFAELNTEKLWIIFDFVIGVFEDKYLPSPEKNRLVKRVETWKGASNDIVACDELDVEI